ISPSCTGSLETSSSRACWGSPSTLMNWMRSGVGGGSEPPNDPERMVPPLTVDPADMLIFGRAWAPPAAPLETVTDWVAAGGVSCALANSKAIWTTRVVQIAFELAKAQ